mmetsp:Transcript_5681/g.13797  ORF Transcript_5681/g.13797 Transcript_5681/m.13797 type:complete len:275 (+) Transcript_5681:366-1190(+)
MSACPARLGLTRMRRGRIVAIVARTVSSRGLARNFVSHASLERSPQRLLKRSLWTTGEKGSPRPSGPQSVCPASLSEEVTPGRLPASCVREERSWGMAPTNANRARSANTEVMGTKVLVFRVQKILLGAHFALLVPSLASAATARRGVSCAPLAPTESVARSGGASNVTRTTTILPCRSSSPPPSAALRVPWSVSAPRGSSIIPGVAESASGALRCRSVMSQAGRCRGRWWDISWREPRRVGRCTGVLLHSSCSVSNPTIPASNDVRPTATRTR